MQSLCLPFWLLFYGYFAYAQVSRDNLQFCPLEELEELEQLEDFPFDPMGAAEERIEDSASGNEHVSLFLISYLLCNCHLSNLSNQIAGE